MAELAARLLGSERPYGSEARQYLLMAAMAGYIAEREPERALELWRTHAKAIARAAATPAFRLLRCHAQNDPRACADDFSVYDER
jgi:hypothetical protein